MSTSLRYILLSVIGSLSYLAALAGIFAGKVTDEAGNPLVGAAIMMDDHCSAFTDFDGRFSFDVEGKTTVNVAVGYVGFQPGTYLVSEGVSENGNVIRVTSDGTSLGEIVVTATRTPKSLKEVPVVTRLITADEIEKTDATNIQDLLTEELPGLEFGYAMSQETSLNMNGFGGNAILFLVDGERLAGETMDNVDYNRLDLENVGQVEIVKGASSALYGANAVGGVVNLISRESREPWHLNLNSRYRDFGKEWRAGGDLNFNSSKWNSNTSVRYTCSETVSLTDVFDTDSRIHEVFGGRTINARERLIFRASDNLRFIARAGCFHRVSNRANHDDRYRDYNGGIRSVWNIDGSQSLEISYGYDRYDKVRYVGGRRTNDHDYSNRQHTMHGLYSKSWGENGLTVGADYLHDYLTTYQFTDNKAHAQTSVDAFVQFDYNPLSWLNIVVSVRDDYFSESDNNSITSRLATMLKLRPLSIRASYSGGFRAPTLKEMYMCFDMAGIQMIYGNPELKPERSHNFNMALERNGQVHGGVMAGSYSLTLSGYYNYYDSRITTTDFQATGDLEEGAIYTNEDGVKVMGADLNARFRTLSGLGASVSYSRLHVAGHKIDSQFSQPRPHSATWRLDYDANICDGYRIYAAISGRYLSRPVSRYETDGAYSLWKLTLRQYVWKGLSINFTVDNLFGYKPKVYYWNSAPTAGRTWSVGISVDVDDYFKN